MIKIINYTSYKFFSNLNPFCFILHGSLVFVKISNIFYIFYSKQKRSPILETAGATLDILIWQYWWKYDSKRSLVQVLSGSQLSAWIWYLILQNIYKLQEKMQKRRYTRWVNVFVKVILTFESSVFPLIHAALLENKLLKIARENDGIWCHLFQWMIKRLNKKWQQGLLSLSFGWCVFQLYLLFYHCR